MNHNPNAKPERSQRALQLARLGIATQTLLTGYIAYLVTGNQTLLSWLSNSSSLLSPPLRHWFSPSQAWLSLDIISPRNETYRTEAVFPIVFGFRDPNNATATLKDFANNWMLVAADVDSHLDNLTEAGPNDLYYGTLVPENVGKDSAQYLWDSIVGMTSNTTKWVFSYVLTADCTDGDRSGRYMRSTYFYFTTDNSAKPYNIAPQDCNDVATFMLNITSESGTEAYNGVAPPFCGYSFDLVPKADPCGAKIPSDKVKNIIAAATSEACHAEKPVVKCPAKPSESSPSAGALLATNGPWALAGLLVCSLFSCA
ncbi:hypothetical protein NLG97_g9471 [Lecanicillium saksenae]|uniref:Uncharacterized protein n=1 Tax=Lecanicillium saksenae TaxID=468837 RepID=A0ACC1QG56_9HYPO|nr:hypothetical protein NLG97_g9471 [Lecanicillium saksenae]